MQIRSESLLAQHSEKAMRLLQRVNSQSEASESKSGSGSPFSNMLVGGVAQVNNMQQSADSQMEQLLTGGDVNQAEVFTSMQKADMSFRLLVQIRNKLMDAYQELNSIHV
ncbi:MAG: flagellar hook-basal body complex protein FliE [Planctomycetota bacterium]|nr:flagellar hook-basal body complex protein FliE [Planctomycetota bacterium]